MIEGTYQIIKKDKQLLLLEIAIKYPLVIFLLSSFLHCPHMHPTVCRPHPENPLNQWWTIPYSTVQERPWKSLALSTPQHVSF